MLPTTKPTIKEVLDKHGITMTAVLLGHGRPAKWNDKSSKGGQFSTRWRCKFKYGDRTMSVPEYSQGSAISYPGEYKQKQLERFRFKATVFMPTAIPPTAEAVMDSLLLDTDSVEQSFEDWCSDFGSDPDSIQAKRCYDECAAEFYALRKFLGTEILAELRDAERL